MDARRKSTLLLETISANLARYSRHPRGNSRLSTAGGPRRVYQGSTIAAVYVDDLLLPRPGKRAFTLFQGPISECFEMACVLAAIISDLGMAITRDI